MGWFEEQIEYRKQKEQELLTDSLQNIASSIMGRRIGSGWTRDGADVRNAVADILKYYDVKEKEVPEQYREIEDILDYQLSASGIMYREVILEKGWHADAMGAMIGTLDDKGTVVALLPQRGGYYYSDPESGRQVRIGNRQEKMMGREAYCFYRPLPQRSIRMLDLMHYMRECLTYADVISFAGAALLLVLVGMLVPLLSRVMIGPVIQNQNTGLLMAVVLFLFFITLGTTMISAIRQLLLERVRTKLDINVSAATMMRVLSLPSDFFKNYTSGELSQYVTYMNSLCSTIVDTIISTGITGIFSLVYLVQIFRFAPSLVIPALGITLLTLLVTLVSSFMEMVISKERMMLSAKERGLVYSLILGIQKIRLSGAENRAFGKWADLYAKEAALEYNPPTLIKVNQVLVSAITLIGTIIMYYVAVVSHVAVEDYFAFNSAYACISSAFSSLGMAAVTIGTIRPILDLIRPLMDAQPELGDGKETVSSIAGGIEFSHVSFRYGDNGPMIIDDLNLSISPRQYVAIVGKTGCGKSTLMRLLLGFEQPVVGSVLYDRKDLNRLNMHSVRRLIGSVMQDGKLFAGSIFDNITISDPSLTLEDAWRAAAIAGLEEDIRRMPMGMHTMIQEGAGVISGGQRQRLMIARAVAGKPKILLLDEATSALDNITQKKVAEALDQMKCTRIVIAHRLSTIRHCDRILVLDGGRIVEDGTYEQLLAADGFFADLVKRQRIDV